MTRCAKILLIHKVRIMTFSLPHTNVTNVFGATIITQTYKKKQRVLFNCGKNVIKSTMSV